MISRAHKLTRIANLSVILTTSSFASSTDSQSELPPIISRTDALGNHSLVIPPAKSFLVVNSNTARSFIEADTTFIVKKNIQTLSPPSAQIDAPVIRLGLPTKTWGLISAAFSILGSISYVYSLATKYANPNKVTFAIWTANNSILALAAVATKDSTFGISQIAVAAGTAVNFIGTLIFSCKAPLNRVEKFCIKGAIAAGAIYCIAKFGLLGGLVAKSTINDISLCAATAVAVLGAQPALKMFFSRMAPDEEKRVIAKRVAICVIPWACYFMARLAAIPSVSTYSWAKIGSAVILSAVLLACSIGSARKALVVKRNAKTK